MSKENLRKIVIRGETFGDRLRDARLSKGWSQPVLAKKLGVSNGTVGNWESDPQSRPRPETLRKIANLFEVEVNVFLPAKQASGGIYFNDHPTASGPSIAGCRAHLEQFLATCTKPEHIGWTYYELQDKFPLDKFNSEPASGAATLARKAAAKDAEEHSGGSSHKH